MSKLYFRYGAMGGGKSRDIIRVYYNYLEKDFIPIVYKPSLDTREQYDNPNNDGFIWCRDGGKIPCKLINSNENFKDRIEKDFGDSHTDILLVDEAQFLTTEQINELYEIVLEKHIPVICYGLKNNFQSFLFEGSKRLLEIADDIDEIKSICWCGRKATQNARVKDGSIIKNGELIEIGGNETYIPLCYTHYKENKIKRS